MAATTGTLQSFVVRRPTASYVASSAILGFFALSPTPPLTAMVLLIAVLRMSALTFAPRTGGYAKGLLQAVFIAVSAGVAHLAPSLDALSTPSVAVVAISAISLVASSFAVGLVFLGCKFGYTASTHWARLTVFPALWASGWAFVPQVSPVGQLVTWSPVYGLGPYEWIRPVFGQWGIDWVAAGWAVLVSEMLGQWVVGQTDQEEDLPVDTAPLLGEEAQFPSYGTTDTPTSPQRRKQSLPGSRSALAFAGLLILLMVPTYITPVTPLPLEPSTRMTPLGAACALPKPRNSGQATGNPTLEDYIYETSTLQSRSNIILWPESAVQFGSAAERDHTFQRIQNMTNGGKYVGVSFEDFVPDRPGKRRNGFALIGSSGPPVLEYYKRNLVPVAESTSLEPGTEPPAVFTFDMRKPKDWKGPGWSKEGNTRPIPITASICLDFAHTSSFTPLKTRPALILAPAKTWHESVGLAMWKQAKARAAETGATILWCDGGKGGLSGIADGRYSEIVQVGAGSWSKTIGIPYPFDERRTFYMRGGQGTVFIAVWAVAVVGYLVEKMLGGAVAQISGVQVLGGARRLITVLLRLKGSKAKQTQPPEGNLLDI